MIEFFLTFFLQASEVVETEDKCAVHAPVRDPAICEPLYDEGSIVIHNMESVAVGSIAEMRRLRIATRHCDVDNRIDHLGGVDLAVYDIINANEVSRGCVIGWINENAPEIKYSEKRLSERFERAPRIDLSDREQ